MSLDLLGETVGLEFGDFGSIFQSAGELAKGGIELYQKEEASKKLAADEKKALEDAIAADISAATAAAKAEVSVSLKASSAEADKEAAEIAASAQARAGAKLSPAAVERRASAAEDALKVAVAKKQANPKDAYAVALVKAWQANVNKAHNANIATKSDESSKGAAARSATSSGGGIGALLTKKVIGPVPVWGVGLGGIAAVVLGRKYIGKH